MDFAAALRFLQTTTNESVSRSHPGRLDRMRALLDLLGNPQLAFRSIHVGGTSGKGSTATMCAAMLGAAGYKIGLHTKPHLRSVTERACIDGVPVSEPRFGELIESMMPAVDEMRSGIWGAPSYFELLVALAFRWFAEERVDAAVIEVGIGGTLDGTNVVMPIVSVLTNVGSDHADVLGDTVEAIAQDKAGIIKDKVPSVTAADHPGALAIIREAALRKRSPLSVVQEVAQIHAKPTAAYEQRARITTRSDAYEISLPLLGEFQLLNAATAIVALEQVRHDLPVDAAQAARGLASVALPGRMEFYPSRPSLVFDIAHNAEKAAALRDGLIHHFPNRRFVFVVAVAEGKASADMLKTWTKLPAHFIFTTFDVSHRAPVQPRRLASVAESLGSAARAVEDPVEALNIARRLAGTDDLVVITGSTFLVGRLREWFSLNVADSSHARA